MDSMSENLDESMLDVIQRAEAFIMAHSIINREAERSSSNLFDLSGNESFHSAADKSEYADDVNILSSGPSRSRDRDLSIPEEATTSSDNVEVLSDDSDATLPYDINPESIDNDNDCVVIEVQNPIVDLCVSLCDETPLSPANRRARRRRADSAPVVDSIILDDTVIETSTPQKRSTTASPSRKRSFFTAELRAESIPNESAPSISARCPICLESIFNQQAASTVCGHLFCNDCIMQEIHIRKKCPMCKRALKKHHVHPIYFN